MENKNPFETVESIILMLIIFLLFPVALFLTGTITSGWNLVDDHETVEIARTYAMQKIPVMTAIKDYILVDLQYRFRPLYWVIRVLSAYTFKLNALVPHIILCMIAMAVYFFLYRFARLFTDKIWLAHLFTLIIMVGRQYEAWYRIANQENMGMFLLAICLYCIARQNKEENYDHKGYNFLFVFTAVGLALTKESFLLLLPGLCVLKIACEGIRRNMPIKEWYRLAISHGVSLILLIGIFTVSIVFILKQIGTTFGGYAGVDTGGHELLWNLLKMPKQSLFPYVLLAAGITALGVLEIVRKSGEFSITTEKSVWILFCVYGMATQIVIYAKSGMWDRYLLPFTFFYAYIFILIIGDFLNINWTRNVFILVITVFLISRAKWAFVNRAMDWGNEGKLIWQMIPYVTQNTEKSTGILAYLGAEELDNSICEYLEFEDRKEGYIYVGGNCYDGYGEAKGNMASLSNMEVVITTPQKEAEIIETMKLDTSIWNRKQFGQEYVVLIEE